MSILQRIVFGLLIGLFVGGGIWAYQQYQLNQGGGGSTALPGEVQVFGSSIGGPIALTAHTGDAYDTSEKPDTWHLIFFGFTFCPDICPGELATIARAYDQLIPAQQARVQPLMVTVDPERDTVQALSEYVPLFHKDFLGLTGSKEQIEQVKSSYAVYAAKAPQREGDDPNLYLVNHSANIYLVNPDQQAVAVFRQNTKPDDLAKGVSARLSAVE